MFEHLSFIEIMFFLMFLALFFKEIATEWLKKQLGLNGKNGHGKDHTPSWAENLTEHFNHETTEILTKILEEQRTHNRLDEEIIAKLMEWEKYGTPKPRQ